MKIHKCEKCGVELTDKNKQRMISWDMCKECFVVFDEENKNNPAIDSGVVI